MDSSEQCQYKHGIVLRINVRFFVTRLEVMQKRTKKKETSLSGV